MAAPITLDWVRARCDIEAGERSPCWLWRGGTNGSGYPLFVQRRAQADGTPGKPSGLPARRVVWALAGRAAPAEGRYLALTCRESRCLNPDHMLAVTRVQYMGRALGGKPRPAHHSAAARKGRRTAPDVKITLEIARSIRARLEGGELQKHVAADLGVSRSLVSMVWRHKHWRETTPFSI